MLLYVFSRLTSMRRGRRVILCIGRMRKEIMGRFLQSGWPSILVSTSLKTEFLELQNRFGRRRGKGDKMSGGKLCGSKCQYNDAGPNPWEIRWGHLFVCVRSLGHSHQPLQGSLLVHLIGAVCDVGIKVWLGMLANEVANVVDHNALLVSFLQFLKKPEHRGNTG